MLYRAVYIAGGKVRGWTFAYDSDEGAAVFAERFVRALQGHWPDANLLTVAFAKPAAATAAGKQRKLL